MVIFTGDQKGPAIDLRMLRIRAVGWGNAATVANGCAVFGLFLALPQLVQADPARGAGFGLGPVDTGLVLAPGAVVIVLVEPAAGWLGGRAGRHIPALNGNLVCAAGLGCLAA